MVACEPVGCDVVTFTWPSFNLKPNHKTSETRKQNKQKKQSLVTSAGN
jgi:hypothetical protein